MQTMTEARRSIPLPSLPAREVPGEVAELAAACSESQAIGMLLEATDHLALILDERGRTLAASGPLLEALGLASATPLLGLSPGEVPSCVWAGPGGCGSGKTCAACGMFLAQEACRRDGVPSAHTSILAMATGSCGITGEFRMRATPLRVADRPMVFLSLQDLSDRQRREDLEQFLGNQILNLVDGLDGTVRILAAEPASAPLLVRQLADFTEQLSQEVHRRRTLLQAENGTLRTQAHETELLEVMESLEACFRNHDAAYRRNLVLRPGPAERFTTDPDLLLRILVDLVADALRATPVGGTVEVEHRREDHHRRFLVRCPGPGSGAPAQGRGKGAKAHADPGLGAFGIKLLAERYLGGAFESTVEGERGICFTLRLPAPEPAAGSDRQPGRTPRAADVPGTPEDRPRLGTILIVDDTRVTRHLVQSILVKDFHILLAESGPEALAICGRQKPDLILLDVVMPEMDGYAVCRRLKGNPATAGIPIIFLTALAGKDYETQALEAGAIDFITKPINPDVVYARVRNHVEMKQAQDHLKDLTLLDGLTGIANRRAFDQALEHEWRRGIRTRKPLSLIMGDVDFFKNYNDCLGHRQGDVCLRSVAQVFASAVHRPSDTAARYGGEEFVCLLGDTDAEGAALVAERIRIGVERLGLAHPRSEAGPVVTVSLGVATFLPDPRTGSLTLVEQADQHLYEAKRTGRNRVVS
jgi:diguanylate cyclase (GGDEF)-like protein